MSIITNLETMDKRIIDMGQSIHMIQVRCDNCSGPHLTKDHDLDENGYMKALVCYSSGDRFVEYWIKPMKEWKPYDEYKK